MSIHELISNLRKADIALELSSGELSIDAPKGGIDAMLLDQLRSRKSELIEFLQESESSQSYESIPVCAPQDHYPVSHAQRRLWILNQFEKEQSAYNLPSAFWLEGQLNIEALDRALFALGQRHEILRTSFHSMDGNPVQTVDPECKLKLIFEDLSGEVNPEDLVSKRATADAAKPFDIANPPLLRAQLLRVQPTKYALLFNMHHIISDGWSINIVIRELLFFYHGFSKGQQPTLAPLPIQYKDYSHWQNQLLESEEAATLRDYWHTTLAGELPALQLPNYQPRPAVRTQNGARVSHQLSDTNAKRLRALSTERGASLYMTLNAVLNLLLYRYSGQKDIIVGASIAGRQHTDLDGLIGFFVNILPVRTVIDPGMSFNGFLEQVKAIVTGAFEHQQYPFDRMVEEIAVGRDLSRHPIFDINIVMHNNDTTELSFEGLSLSPIPSGGTTSRFDMAFSFYESKEGIDLSIEYNSDLFEPALVQSMARHFEHLCYSITEAPKTTISQLALLPEADYKHLLNNFNPAVSAFPKDHTIVELFEQQVARTPDSLALIFEGTELTYRELNDKANTLAKGIQDQYAPSPDDLIAFMPDRNEWMIIGLLGILKSGAAYLPIDPTYPPERIQYILNDAAPKLLVLHSDYLFHLPDYQGEMLAIDIQFDAMEPATENVKSTAKPENLAYVIYTSGSSGNPKGVLVEHRSLIHSTTARTTLYNIQRMLLISPIAFDSSVAVLWGTLTQGGALVLIGETTLMDTSKTVELIVEQQVSDLLCVPSYYAHLLTSLAEHGNQLALRTVIAAGEQLPTTLVQQHHKSLPQTKLYNEYGPTENTVWSTVALTNENTTKVSIGKPISNVQAYIVNEFLQLNPAGVAGELCLAGSGLARGYLNNPELTAEKFVANPFVSGQRMYRTGDLAKWLPDGSIDFLGRIDNQVKIRGYRIELGEIEASLLKHSQVSEAAVLDRQDKEGNKYLCAFITSPDSLSVEMLRNHLAAILPSYMIPASFVQLAKMPLNANGKLDRKQLLETDENGMAPGSTFQAPKSEIEIILAQVWAQVLNTKNIGIDDNFFHLGGDSLKAIQVISGMQNKGFELTLNELFRYPTIRELSLPLQRTGNSEKSAKASSIVLNEVQENKLFAFPPLYGVAISYADLARKLDGVCFIAFDFLEASNRLEQYYTAIKEIQPDGPYVFGGYSAGTALAFDVARYFENQGEQVSDLVLIDGQPSAELPPKTNEDLAQRAEHLLALAEEDAESNQAARLIVQDVALRDRVKNTLMAYDHYLSAFPTVNSVQANIHLLLDADEDATVQARKLEWQQHTSGSFTLLQGEGHHRQLFFPNNLETNAKHLNDALHNIFDEK